MKLNLGSGPNASPGWINVDASLGARFAKLPGSAALSRRLGLFGSVWDDSIVVHDLRRPLPWPTATVECVYASHTLQFLTRQEGRALLKECHRVLRPGGLIRIVSPDLRHHVARYAQGEVKAEFFIENLRVLPIRTGLVARLTAPLLEFRNRCMYDPEALLRILGELDFSCWESVPFESGIDDIEIIESKRDVSRSIIVEGARSGRSESSAAVGHAFARRRGRGVAIR